MLLGLPPAALLLFGTHLFVGATCLFFGFRLKRSFRWVLLLVGSLELGSVALLLAMTIGAPR